MVCRSPHQALLTFSANQLKTRCSSHTVLISVPSFVTQGNCLPNVQSPALHIPGSFIFNLFSFQIECTPHHPVSSFSTFHYMKLSHSLRCLLVYCVRPSYTHTQNSKNENNDLDSLVHCFISCLLTVKGICKD